MTIKYVSIYYMAGGWSKHISPVPAPTIKSGYFIRMQSYHIRKMFRLRFQVLALLSGGITPAIKFSMFIS
jgi:hypothetical protein